MTWKRGTRWIVTAAALALAGCESARQPLSPGAAATMPALSGRATWQLDHGKWVEVTTAQTRSITAPRRPLAARPNALLDKAARLLAQREPDKAHDLLLPYLLDHRDAPDRDRALYLFSDVYFQLGNRVWSFYYLDELMDECPESRLFYPALEKQYQIADSYLNGYKEKFLGLAIVSREDEGVEMLFRIQERSPGSPLAEKSLLRTANYYFNSSQFDLASDVYLAYIRGYPTSPKLAQIKLRRAFSAQAQFRGLPYDSTPLIDARVQFEEIQRQYPQVARDENVQSFIDAIDQTLARKLYARADFYLRTNQPRSAAWTLSALAQRYPRTPESGAARQQLAKMGPALLVAPAGATPEAGPSTRPAAPPSGPMGAR